MLYLFDLDGTIIRSFLREGAPRTPAEYAKVELLPRRLDRLRGLEVAHTIAFVTNQGGVAFGYQTVQEVISKVVTINNTALGDGHVRLMGRLLTCSSPERERIAPALFYIAYTHPKATIERYKTDDDWRKPGAGMIRRAIDDYRSTTPDTLFVGDMDSDRECAANAGVSYEDAEDFFGG
jgi:HAD superfamily hydrolase (TIGR01662 family)